MFRACLKPARGGVEGLASKRESGAKAAALQTLARAGGRAVRTPWGCISNCSAIGQVGAVFPSRRPSRGDRKNRCPRVLPLERKVWGSDGTRSSLPRVNPGGVTRSRGRARGEL